MSFAASVTLGRGLSIPAETDSGAQTERRRDDLWSCAVAGLMAIFFLVSSIYLAAHSLFWFDELFTVRISGVMLYLESLKKASLEDELRSSKLIALVYLK